MKGNSKFSETEAVEIRRILAELRLAERNEQKQLRHKLRKDYKFFISDFAQSNKGFTVGDFDRLIESREIEIGSS